MRKVLGIDFGFSEERPSFGYSQFFLGRVGPERFEIQIAAPSAAVALDEFLSEIIATSVVTDASLIALDAPVTPQLIQCRPVSGRPVEKRFSRGTFSNGRRGPQPSSIAVPAQGWPLYCAAMNFVARLAQHDFPLAAMPAVGQEQALDRCVIEVIPKLTQALLTPPERIAGRPSKSDDGFYGQIDNWLFPHLFIGPPAPMAAQALPNKPHVGCDCQGMLDLLGATVQVRPSVWAEAGRIQQVEDLDERHELIGAFVAGFQGAMALAGVAKFVGTAEGYYVLPGTWHNGWQAVWQATRKAKDSVYSVPIAACGG